MRSYGPSMKNISVDLSTEVVSLLCRYSKGRQSDKKWFRTSITGNLWRMEKAWATAIVRGSRSARISQRPWRNIRESIRHVVKVETKKRIKSDLPCFEWRFAWHTCKSYRSSRKILLLNWTRFLIFFLHRVDSNLLPTSYFLISSGFYSCTKQPVGVKPFSHVKYNSFVPRNLYTSGAHQMGSWYM